VRGFVLAPTDHSAIHPGKNAGRQERCANKLLSTAPAGRPAGEIGQNCERPERDGPKIAREERNQPLTRPAAADEYAVAVHPLPRERAFLP